MDAVELVLRAEEFFTIAISDEEAAQVRTVGDFYELICAQLGVMALAAPVTSDVLPVLTERDRSLYIFVKHTPLPAPADVLPWSPQTVWDCVVTIVVDQLGIKKDEVIYDAKFVEDLGVD